MTEPRSFSGQVYDLANHQDALADIAARTKRYVNRPPALEVVWLLPHDARPVNLRFDGPAGLPALFGIPVVVAPVDRPYLALRPVAPPEGEHVIRDGAAQAMAEYDYGTDPYGAGVELP